MYVAGKNKQEKNRYSLQQSSAAHNDYVCVLSAKEFGANGLESYQVTVISYDRISCIRNSAKMNKNTRPSINKLM